MTENEQTQENVPTPAPAQAQSAEVPFTDPAAAETEFNMAKDIKAMPAEVQDRFKAVMALTSQMNRLDEEEDLAYRIIERKYEKLYQKVYEKRAALLKGDTMPDPAVVNKYEELKQSLMDADYDKAEVEFVDVKEIQNTTKGVSGFWLRAMLNHTHQAKTITERDRPILAYLQDIQLFLSDEDYSYTLKFIFEPNAYFKQTELTVSCHCIRPNVITKFVCTEIEWTAGSDPTTEKKKKKVKKNGKAKTVTTTVKCDSFFNFFQSRDSKDIDMDGAADDSDDDKEDLAEIFEDYGHTALEFKEEVIPLALELYLGVVNGGDDLEAEDDDDEDEEDEDEPKPKGKKKGGDAAGKKGQEECKQQ